MAQFDPMNTKAELLEVANNSASDIDLMAVFKSILGVWKTWVLAILITSVVFCAIKSAQILFLVNEATYSKPIRLTFPNAHKLMFPSGAKFSYGDIVAPAIAQLAFERNNLKDYGLTVAELQGGLSVAPYAPTYPFIIKKYEKLLADKKLGAEQISELQKRMEEEIQQATSGEALISLRLDKKELPKEVAERLLADIPQIWADRTLHQKGVLNVNIQLSSVGSLNANLLKDADETILSDILASKLTLLRQNVIAISALEGTQSVVDTKSSMKLSDLRNAIEDYSNYVLGSNFAPIRILGLSNNPKAAIYYYEDKINRLKMKLSILQREAGAIQEVHGSYLPSEKGQVQGNADNRNGGVTSSPQFNADMLDKLINMSGDTVREKYRQSLNDKWIAYSQQIAALEAEISDSQTTLSLLQKASTVGKQSSTDEQYLAKVKANLPQIVAQLEAFFAISERIYNQLSIESVGFKDQLYVPVTNTILVKKVLIDIKATILAWMALMVLVTVIIVPFCMVRNSMKDRNI